MPVRYNDGAIRTFDLNQVDLESKFVPHDCAVVQIMYSLDKKVPQIRNIDTFLKTYFIL